MTYRYGLSVGLLCIVIFILALLGIVQGWLQFFDDHTLITLNKLASPDLTRISIFMSLLGSGWVVTPLALAAFVWLRRLAPNESLWFLGTVTGGLLLFLAVVFVVDRPRPTLFDSPVSEPTASFPSGHAMNTTVTVLSLYLALKRLRIAWHTWLGGAGIVIVMLVGTSRLYLQIHFPSDIIAGIALAAGWVLLLDGRRSLRSA